MRKTVPLPTKSIFAAALVAFASFQAVAQTAQPTAPMDSVPEKVAPDPKPSDQPTTLSQKLDQSNGVIRPKEVDPAMEKAAPTTHTNDVIPPPGTPGGAPAPQPK